MHRIDSAGAVAAPPAPAAVGSTVGYWTKGNAAGGVPATVIDPDWLNSVQEELIAVVTAAGLVPSKTTRNQLLASLQAMYRTKLTADTTFYVATTGSDSNTGLSAAAPFRTLQKAWDSICQNYDLNNYTATIKVAGGTYTAGIATNLRPANGAIIIDGNTAVPAAVTINVADGVAFSFFDAGRVSLRGLSIAAGGVNAPFALKGIGISAARGTSIAIRDIVFYACSLAHLFATQGAVIYYDATAANQVAIAIQGGALMHAGADQGGFVSLFGGTVTLTGTPVFSLAFAQATFGALVQATATVFSGGATGPRYSAGGNAVIYTAGAGATYLPGNAAGTVSTGGQYI